MRAKLLTLVAVSFFCASCAEKAPPPPPQPQTAPKPAYFEHTITFSGETLADIALHYTGKATNWTAIRDVNPGLKPDRLKIGQTVLIPYELVINDKPFTKTSLKRVPKSVTPTPTPAPEATAPATTDGEPKPEMAVEPTPTAAPTPVATEAVPAPTAQPTPEPTPEVKPTEAAPPVAATPAAGGDQDREKLLDELLK